MEKRPKAMVSGISGLHCRARRPLETSARGAAWLSGIVSLYNWLRSSCETPQQGSLEVISSDFI